ncbi:SRPBCC family protein [Rhodococcus sp. NPDC127528]|uniref:SRPBCC family protein n=1 Tax=unclassified Rhodococcus (in: high G+C Gram-positive bacteria) TaxID=192944 RepID=UPI00363071C4
MEWYRSYSVVTAASAESVYRRWTDIGTWAEDDADLDWVRVDGPVRVGATGKVKTGGPAQRITFTELTPGRAMNFEIGLPGATLSFPHAIEQLAEGIRVTHGVRFSGPLASLFGFVAGRKIAMGLPLVVRTVVDRALEAEDAALDS